MAGPDPLSGPEVSGSSAPTRDIFGPVGPPVSRNAAFYRGFWGAIGVLLALLVAYAVSEISDVLEVVLIALFLAVGLNPIVELLERVRVRRSIGVLVVALAFIGVVTLVVVVLIGVLEDQVQTLIKNGPHLLDALRKHKTIRSLDHKYHFIENLQKKLKNPDLTTDTLGKIFSAGASVVAGVVDAVIVFVLTLYFLAALPQLKRAMYSLAPATRRDRVRQLGDEILRRVGRYVIGAFLVALLAGTVTLVFLLSAGLGDFALPLALLVALLDLVPLVGSIAGAGIVCLICFATSLDTGIAAVIVYLIYEPLEGYVIYPRVMRTSVDVPEYFTVIAVLIGGGLAGIVGALLALPIGAAGLLLVREVWVKRQDVT